MSSARLAFRIFAFLIELIDMVGMVRTLRHPRGRLRRRWWRSGAQASCAAAAVRRETAVVPVLQLDGECRQHGGNSDELVLVGAAAAASRRQFRETISVSRVLVLRWLSTHAQYLFVVLSTNDVSSSSLRNGSCWWLYNICFHSICMDVDIFLGSM